MSHSSGGMNTCRTAAHPDVGAVLEVQALQLGSGRVGSLQALHDLRPADVQTLGEVDAPQGRQGQEVGEACRARDAALATASGFWLRPNISQS